MSSSCQKSSWVPAWAQSSPSNRNLVKGANVGHEGPHGEPLPGESPRYRAVPYPVSVDRDTSALSKAPEPIREGKEQMRDGAQQLYKRTQSSDGGSRHQSSAHHEAAPVSPRVSRRDGDDPSFSPPLPKKSKGSAKPNTATSDVNTPSQTAEPSKLYGPSSREHDPVPGELKAKLQRLGDKDNQIMALQAEIDAQQGRYEERLALARREIESCHAQLDNVQRFISTADTHSDRDIVRKVQELNEEVYQTSMMMAEDLTPHTRQTKAYPPVGESVSVLIGQAMVDRLAKMESEENVTMFLQIAFQGYLSHLLCRIVSSWTIDPMLDDLIERTYQRLRTAEQQAISGRWRYLTRTYISPTPVTDSNVPVEYKRALSDIVMAAGLVPGALSSLESKFDQKMSTIIAHAGKFGGMVSGMISSDFEVFAVRPGAMFDAESMVDVGDGKSTPGAAQTVLCVSGIGLRKRIGEKTLMLTKAEVVLESFLG